MWHPSTVKAVPSTEPVTLQQAKEQCGILDGDAAFDGQLARLIKMARVHVERYCNARWAEQELSIACDGFADFERLPEGPLKSVTSVEYTDAAGVMQTVSDTVYQANRDGLEPSIVLKHGQSWPLTRPGSRVTLTAVFGGEVPEDVQHAMLLIIADNFLIRESARREDWTSLDALLCNHRRGA